LLISFLKFVIALLPAAAIGLALKSALDAWGTSGPIEAIVSAGIVATSVVIAYFPVLILLRESSAIDLIKPFRRIAPTRD
jgi:phosphotransferase system  glucose/maltose/N-acetylglucosamine-specific IIC component